MDVNVHFYQQISNPIQPNSNGSLPVGVDYVFDTTVSRNFSLIESAHEFVRRYKNRDSDKTVLPMLASACPGECR